MPIKLPVAIIGYRAGVKTAPVYPPGIYNQGSVRNTADAPLGEQTANLKSIKHSVAVAVILD
jgi:hypothetical protein